MPLITDEQKNITTYIGQHRELTAATAVAVDRTTDEINCNSAGVINIIEKLGPGNFLELSFYRAIGTEANTNFEIWAGNSLDAESFRCITKGAATTGTATHGTGHWCDSITLTAISDNKSVKVTDGIANDIAHLRLDPQGLDCVYLVISEATYKCLGRVY